MLKVTTLALAAGLLAVPAAHAQVLDLGRGGPQLDFRPNAQRERDYRRDHMREDRYYSGRRDHRDLSTGSLGCRSVTVRERDAYGRMVSRTRRDC
jgi:hypothetical protein